ncbi:MAG: hypothetical protein LUD17_04355, partial [Bacteroidales bacterium]|nr:hypothetical protein [Bacteroidales bacterium]
LAPDYPHFSPYAFCLGDPVNWADPDGMKPSEEEAARMSHHVYGDEYVELIGGWYKSGTILYDKNLSNGLKCGLYERIKDDGIKEYALVFSGTHIMDIEDWKNNVLQLIGLSSQYKDAIELAKELKQDMSHYFEKNGLKLNDLLTFSGHSLGGGLATACAYATDGSAMVFNPAGVSFLTQLPNPKAKVDSYITITDPLNDIQFRTPLPDAGGRIHWRNSTQWNSHSITNFYKAF